MYAGVSRQFRDELRRDSHTVAIKAVVLDSSRRPVSGGTIYDKKTASVVKTSSFQNILVDGSVDIDTDRDTQRTFTATILNDNGEFSPGSTWGGLFYVNRLIRLYRGLIINQTAEWVPIGTFMIDTADTVVERNMSTVVLSGQDQWKRFSKAFFAKAGSYPAGTKYNTIVEDLAADVGLTGSELDLDKLHSRSADDRKLSKALKYEQGDNKGDLLSAMLKKAGIDIYFDPMGVLVTQDMQTASDRAPVWSFTDSTSGGMLLAVTRTTSDDKLYNRVICVGTGASTTYTATKGITSPTNPLGPNMIGERTKIIESRAWKTQGDVDKAVKKYWDDYRVISETIALEVICNPALEGNDVISVTETSYANLNKKTYRIKQMSIPLSSSRSKIVCRKNIEID